MRIPFWPTGIGQSGILSHHDGAAAVLPVADDGRILMVRQYRNALDRYTLEIPAGKLDDPAEPKAECAFRELEEETGYRVDSKEQLEYLISLTTTVAFCDEAIDIFVAHHLIPSHQHLDEDEVINVVPCTLEELVEMIYTGSSPMERPLQRSWLMPENTAPWTKRTSWQEKRAYKQPEPYIVKKWLVGLTVASRLFFGVLTFYGGVSLSVVLSVLTVRKGVMGIISFLAALFSTGDFLFSGMVCAVCLGRTEKAASYPVWSSFDCHPGQALFARYF